MDSSVTRPLERIAESTLCSRCQELPFESLFTGAPLRSLDQVEQPGPLTNLNLLNQSVQFGSLEELWRQEHCAFCKLLRHTFEAHYSKSYMATKRGSRAILHIMRTPLDMSYDFYTAVDRERVAFCLELGITGAVLTREEKETGDEFTQATVLPKVQLVLPDGDSNQRPLFGRSVDHETIDWGHLKHWVKACDCRHNVKEASDASSSMPHGGIELFAIDVDYSYIVQLPQNAKYIALSYMWGKDQRVKLKKANSEMLGTPGFFNSSQGRPSKTIADAMGVARLLGCRYLWVDALCIIQDDEMNLQANINNMDQVYAKAWVTIVAAAGVDADAGLPGVTSDNPRTERQMIVKTRGLVMTNMLQGDADVINFSRWNTRAWTYQERLLSPRLLTFTQSQVYYTCDQGCNFREDLHVADGSATLTLVDARYQLEYQDMDLFEVYGTAVAEYTKRSLTDPSDKLKAMNGLFNLLTGPFRGPFFFGIPATIFDVCLLWMPTGACSRGSKKFPSWSWAGWNGSVKYAARYSMGNMCECTVSQATLESANSVRLSTSIESPESAFASRERPSGEWRRCFDEEMATIYYKSSHPEYQQYQYPRPLSTVRADDCRLLAQEVTGVLKIHAMTAFFRITGTHSSKYVLFSTCNEGWHEQCNLAIFDDHGRETGTVFVDGRLVPELKNKKHKFLALSRTTLSRTDIDPSWDDEEQCFRPWTDAASGTQLDVEGDLVNMNGKVVNNKECFDVTRFSPDLFWPLFNVLLLSEPENGTVERIGIGQIHVDAFSSVATQECVFLS